MKTLTIAFLRTESRQNIKPLTVLADSSYPKRERNAGKHDLVVGSVATIHCRTS